MRHELSNPEDWLDLHGDILYRYVISRVRDSAIAEDLVQETLLAALSTKENYAGKAAEQTWLIGILKHKIIDYFRKAAREQNQEFNEQLTETGNDDFFDQRGRWQLSLSTWGKPDQAIQQEQFIRVLEICIDQLPPRMAQLYLLRELDGMRSEEICGCCLFQPSITSG